MDKKFDKSKLVEFLAYPIGFDSRRELRGLVARGRGRPPEVRSVPLVLRIPSDRTKSRSKTACAASLLLFGLPDRIRTYGLQSRSLSLYPAGLRVDTLPCIITFCLSFVKGFSCQLFFININQLQYKKTAPNIIFGAVKRI